MQTVIFFYSDVDDPELPGQIIPDRPVTFEVVEQGSKRRFKKLVGSDGFAYTVKVSVNFLF